MHELIYFQFLPAVQEVKNFLFSAYETKTFLKFARFAMFTLRSGNRFLVNFHKKMIQKKHVSTKA